MFNSCTFVGNMGNDPEVRTSTGGTAFTTFSIAVNKQGDKEAKPLWVNVTAFGKTGEFVAKYLKKGSSVLVTGEVELQEYEGKDGKNHSSLKLLSNKVVSLTKREGTAPMVATAGATAKAATVTDEDIPF